MKISSDRVHNFESVLSIRRKIKENTLSSLDESQTLAFL